MEDHIITVALMIAVVWLANRSGDHRRRLIQLEMYREWHGKRIDTIQDTIRLIDPKR